jgi:hypothetical protein
VIELLDVPAAAKGLDQLYPGWQNWIDLEKLNMFSCDNCILGQIGTHVHGAESHYVTWNWNTMRADFHTRVGVARDGVFASEIRRPEWEAEIKARRFDWQEQLDVAPREEVLA